MRNKLMGLLWLLITCGTRAEHSHDYLNSHPLKIATIDDLEIAYRIIGQGEHKPKSVWIMGLGGSNVAWGDALISGLEDAGYESLLLDNRDTGASTRFQGWGQPTLWFQLLKYNLGFSVNAPYDLDDMAKDVVDLMDFVGYENAHIVGISMGGMIAQIIAAKYPQRSKSLISIMSTPLAPHLPPPTMVAEDELRDIATGESQRELEINIRNRGFYPESMQRHLMAILKTGDRSDEVATIEIPTLVIHGSKDGLIPSEHGLFTAKLITNSHFELIDEMGHNMPARVVPIIVSHISSYLNKVEKNEGMHPRHNLEPAKLAQ